MKKNDFAAAPQREAITTCPHCGGVHYQDNRIDDRLYIEAAKEAPRLRFEGQIDDAVDVLTALYAIRIANFLRPRWRCECGVTFDL